MADETAPTADPAASSTTPPDGEPVAPAPEEPAVGDTAPASETPAEPAADETAPAPAPDGAADETPAEPGATEPAPADPAAPDGPSAGEPPAVIAGADPDASAIPPSGAEPVDEDEFAGEEIVILDVDLGSHPEPTPIGQSVHQDNVSEPGVETTHNRLADGTVASSRHKTLTPTAWGDERDETPEVDGAEVDPVE